MPVVVFSLGEEHGVSEIAHREIISNLEQLFKSNHINMVLSLGTRMF